MGGGIQTPAISLPNFISNYAIHVFLKANDENSHYYIMIKRKAVNFDVPFIAHASASPCMCTITFFVAPYIVSLKSFHVFGKRGLASVC